MGMEIGTRPLHSDQHSSASVRLHGHSQFGAGELSKMSGFFKVLIGIGRSNRFCALWVLKSLSLAFLFIRCCFNGTSTFGRGFSRAHFSVGKCSERELV